MSTKVDRRTVDLSTYPNLVVIYLGMRVNRLTGIKTLLGFGPQIANSAAAKPDGLLCHENLLYSFFPMHGNGCMEAIYDDLPKPIGFSAFARVVPARGPMFVAASRTAASSTQSPVLSEDELYSKP